MHMAKESRAFSIATDFLPLMVTTDLRQTESVAN
jgi:hypothetical protein